ncbi:MAG: MFS transporter [Candidatus Thermoplasmatota archaeon]|nr:MFS transporter [Candidatus Thermoplasmatota archaeon]MEC8353004.1 MFS transporter [Candidatus Thermoplasmatota archaeon]
MTDTTSAEPAVNAGKGALLVLFLATVIDMIGFGIVIPFLTYLVEDLAASEGIAEVGLWVGLLMTSYSAAQFLFSPFWGSVSDRIGRRPVLMIGLVGNTVFFTMFGLANTLFIALAARFMAGVFNGNLAVARAYIGDVSTPSQLNTRMGLIGAAFGLGFTIGPFIGGELSNPAEKWDIFVGTIFETYPYLLPCVAAGVLSLISFVYAYFYLPESLPKSKRSISDKLNWTKKLSNSFKQSYSMLNRGVISVIIWATFLFIFGFTIMHAVFILYTGMPVEGGGLSYNEAQNGRIFAVIGIAGILTQGVLIGPLSKRLGAKKLLPLSCFICGTGLILIPYTQAEHATIQLVLVATIVAIGSGLFQPSSSTLLTKFAKDGGINLGIVMGAQESISSFARILGPLTGGVVWTFTVSRDWPLDYHTAFHLCGLLMLCSALLSLKIGVVPDSSNRES